MSLRYSENKIAASYNAKRNQLFKIYEEGDELRQNFKSSIEKGRKAAANYFRLLALV